MAGTSQVGSRSPSAGYQSTTTIGMKRKRPGSEVFYAVRMGHRPDIYLSHEDALRQLKGFSNGQYKRFETRAQAEAFMKSGPDVASRFVATRSQKFYGVRVGRVPGVYNDWASTKQQVDGFANARQKSFHTMAQAQAYIDGNDTPEGEAVVEKAASKKQRALSSFEIDENVEPGTGPMPPVSEDGFDSRVLLNPDSGKVEYKSEAQRNATKMQPVGMVDGGVINIYTDGSALGNGTAGSYAGVGVYFGPMDARNASEPLKGPRQTNQRAELTAIQRAIEIAPKDRHIKLFSDSSYSINCLTVWFPKWRQNNWRTAGNKAVENRDLIEPILNKIDERARLGSKTSFVWVKGHSDDPGNVAADSLAVAASNLARSEGMAPETKVAQDNMTFEV